MMALRWSRDWWLPTMALMLAAVMALLVVCGGCSLPANPRTSLSAGLFGSGFSFADSKDNDIEIKNAVFDAATKSFQVEAIIIRNNASDVRRANVEQIAAYTEQVKAVTAMFAAITESIASRLPPVPGTAPVP